MTSLLVFSTLSFYTELKKTKHNNITENSNGEIILPYLHIPIITKMWEFQVFLN